MDIKQHQDGAVLTLVLAGRLDSAGANHLDAELAAVVRSGGRDLRLDLAGVSFLSSAGIRILLTYYRELKKLNGAFGVVNSPPAVREVIDLSGLSILIRDETPEPVAAAAVPAAAPVAGGGETANVAAVVRTPGAGPLRCRLIGDPGRLAAGRGYDVADCRTVAVTRETLAVGIGAFGGGFAECRGAFGEFLAAGGAAACLPTDGGGTPDYLLASGNFIPEPCLLHGVVCEGTPGMFFHFEPWAARVPVPMSEVARLCLDQAGADSAALVMLADTAGLLGAALKRSPAAGDVPAAPLAFPEIRQWLSFTPERAHVGSLALVVGVVARATAAMPASFFRPLGGAAGSPLAHLHAAAFTFQALPDGFRPLATAMSGLFSTQRLQGLLHLIHDDRVITGGGESLFWRGNVWCGPLASLEVAL